MTQNVCASALATLNTSSTKLTLAKVELNDENFDDVELDSIFTHVGHAYKLLKETFGE